MALSKGFTFIAILGLTQTTLANPFGNGADKILINSSAEIVTTVSSGVIEIPKTSPAPAPASPQAQQPTVAPAPIVNATEPAAPAPEPEKEMPRIEVDISKQVATIWYVGLPKPIKVFISSGGGIKIPNSADRLQDGAKPYCGHHETPRVTDQVVLANRFVDGGVKQNEKFTTFERYESGAFESDNGAAIPMPFAIRIPSKIQDKKEVAYLRTERGYEKIDCNQNPQHEKCKPRYGIFFHEGYGSDAQDALGNNISGGCIRLPKAVEHPEFGDIKVAQKLWQQTNQFGGIRVTIKGDDPPGSEKRCNDLIVKNKREQILAERRERDESFGRKIWNFFAGDNDEEERRAARRPRPDRTSGGRD